ncbi:hypothetical protein [Novosphingobium sp.]|uniref:hypothetical protein n=1 Tax=Novosphingobium sp. TaxID=1874826 RepID=UPI003D09AD35
MRAIMAFGLAWSVLVSATPSLADRYIANSHLLAQQDPVMTSVAGQNLIVNDPVSAARLAPASDLRVACRPDMAEADLDDAHAPKSRSVIFARHDGSPSETITTGLCR